MMSGPFGFKIEFQFIGFRVFLHSKGEDICTNRLEYSKLEYIVSQ